MRADVYLFSHGMSESRTKARADIESGRLFVNGMPVKRCSFDIKDGDTAELRGSGMPFVGRGGLKLLGAFEAFGKDAVKKRCVYLAGEERFEVAGAVCADIGASTGGFTDCLLSFGAKRVYAVDCGSGQLHEKLRADSRVINMENFNARELSAESLGEKCDAAVMDVSFISQTLLFPAISRILKPGGKLISLIKPQFEAGRAALGGSGIVRDKKLHALVIRQTAKAAKENGFSLAGLAPSPVAGGDGNREYLSFYVFSDAPPLTLTNEALKDVTGDGR